MVARRFVVLMPVFAAVALQACTARTTDPAIVTSVEAGKWVVVATTADRRMFAIGANGRMCGEAPASVAENLSANAAISGKASVSGPSIPAVGGEGNVATNNDTSIQNVAKKSQGLMLYEDHVAAICSVFLSDPSMTWADYVAAINQIAAASVQIIALEIQVTNGKIGPNITTPVVLDVAPTPAPVSGPTPASPLAPAAGKTPPAAGETGKSAVPAPAVGKSAPSATLAPTAPAATAADARAAADSAKAILAPPKAAPN